MIAISIKFLAGRYHATPWGRHVNEGAVEWPPSPWRILRALVAVWKRTLPDLPQEEVEPVFRTLACSSPEFVLPSASTGHTRHFMPWFKKGPDDRTLVFDTFVAVLREDELVVRWSDASLDEGQRCILNRILENLNTLGRSESWCEARMEDAGDDPAAAPKSNSWPLGSLASSEKFEIVRLLCADSDSAFADDRVVTVKSNTIGRGKNKQIVEERSSIYDPSWNMCMETLQLHKERWSDPPGSRWMQYVRPRDCFKIEQKPRVQEVVSRLSYPQILRFALDSAVLPLVTETLPIAEALRRALMSLHGRLTEQDGVRGRSDTLSGKNAAGKPFQDHSHAYYLPTDEDGDGRIDHLTLIARAGFDADEMRAIRRLREIRPWNRDNASHPLRVLLLGYGRLEDGYRPNFLGPACEWVSATPYLATRYAKTRGSHRVDLRSREDRAIFLTANLREQIQDVRGDLGMEAITSVKIVPTVDEFGVFRLFNRDGHGNLRPIQFQRYRSKRGDDGGRRLAGSFRIVFSSPVSGPFCFGHSAHCGLGLFVPDNGR